MVRYVTTYSVVAIFTVFTEVTYVRNFTVIQNVLTSFGTHPASYSMAVGAVSPRINLSEREANLVQNLRMMRHMPSLSYIPSWLIQRQVYLYL